jgi:hypothetical protein
MSTGDNWSVGRDGRRGEGAREKKDRRTAMTMPMMAMETNFQWAVDAGRRDGRGEQSPLYLVLELAPNQPHLVLLLAHHHRSHRPPYSKHPHPARRPRTLPRAPPGAARPPIRTTPAAASNIKPRPEWEARAASRCCLDAIQENAEQGRGFEFQAGASP